MLMYAVRLRIVNSQHRKKVGTQLDSMFLMAVAQNLMGSSCAKAKCNLPPREIAAFKAIIKTASFYVLGCNFTNQSFQHYHLTRFQFLQFFKRGCPPFKDDARLLVLGVILVLDIRGHIIIMTAIFWPFYSGFSPLTTK